MLAAYQRRSQRGPDLGGSLEAGEPAAAVAAAAAAAAADVLPNCRSCHAETILSDHFKASAIGVSARLNQLQNASSVFIPNC